MILGLHGFGLYRSHDWETLADMILGYSGHMTVVLG